MFNENDAFYRLTVMFQADFGPYQAIEKCQLLFFCSCLIFVSKRL